MWGKKFGAVACMIAGLAACSSKRVTALGAAEQSPHTVMVRNDNWMDVVVYVIRSGMRHRIGTVSGLSSATLGLQQGLLVDGTVRLQVDPIGSKVSYTTDPVHVAPGQRAELRVMNRLSHSTLSVWNP